MTSSKKSALDRAILESLAARQGAGPTPAERYDMERESRMTVRERLELLAELNALARAVSSSPLPHEPIRGKIFLL